jgi:hypothetical protein
MHTATNVLFLRKLNTIENVKAHYLFSAPMLTVFDQKHAEHTLITKTLHIRKPLFIWRARLKYNGLHNQKRFYYMIGKGYYSIFNRQVEILFHGSPVFIPSYKEHDLIGRFLTFNIPIH